MPGKSQVHMLQPHKTQHFLVVTSSSPMTFPWSLLGSIMVFTKSLRNAFLYAKPCRIYCGLEFNDWFTDIDQSFKQGTLIMGSNMLLILYNKLKPKTFNM